MGQGYMCQCPIQSPGNWLLQPVLYGRAGGREVPPPSSCVPLLPVIMELKASLEQCVGPKSVESTPEPAEALPASAPLDQTPTPTSTEVR